jgi:hypothetical protein
MIVAVAVLHFAFILFVAFGGFLVMRWRRVALIHLPAVAWGVLLEVFRWTCPLTSLENALRRRASGEGFIEHYLFRAIYPTQLTRAMEIAIAAFVIVLNAALYWRASTVIPSAAEREESGR